MTQRTVSNFLQLFAFQELYIAHARGRPQMVHDRIGFVETFSGDDMLISDALVFVGRPLTIATEPNMMLPRHFTELLIIRHCRILLLFCHSDPAVAGEESLINMRCLKAWPHPSHSLQRFAQHDTAYKFPLAACSRSMASNNALKLPLPKLFAPLR